LRGRLQGRVEQFLSLNSIALGPAIQADGVRGYPIDFRSERDEPRVMARFVHEPGRYLWGLNAERGLACYERWLAGEGERWLDGAQAAADVLVANQSASGAWLQHEPFGHTFVLPLPWVSALAQGQGASLLVRVHLETGDDRYAEAALAAVRPFSVASSDGGVQALLEGRPFPEEYPTQPPSFVLNGAILGLWGLRDVGVGLADAEITRMFEDGVDTLAATIHRWDSGHWSLYDLVPRRIANVASPGYHAFHITQLQATHLLSPRPELQAAAERFARYASSDVLRARAFAEKALFRLAEPRSERLARVLPWART
jgi:heparosan-N-sulfate-glucuronate 5-epimerase